MSDVPETPVAPPPAPKRGGSRVLIILTVLTLVVFAAVGGFAWWAMSRVESGDVEQGSFLHVELSGALPDAPPQPGLFDPPDEFAPTVTEIAKAIRMASGDERIDGLYLELDGAMAGWASWQEIRAAVVDFEASGKPCVAYSASVVENGAYYLGSACSTTAMAPAGVMLVNGLQIEVTYLKDMLGKLGIEPEYEHVGDFKSAIETFERTGPSEPAAQAYEGIIDSLYTTFLADIAEGRGVTVEEADAWIDTPTLSPAEAVERGMLDALAWPDAMDLRVDHVADPDWLEQLEQPISDEDEKNLTPLGEYIKDVRAEERGSGTRIAVLHAEGSIVSGDAEPSLFGGDENLTDGKYAKMMRKIRDDDSIAAVVVRVNSPGGSALASSLMWRENARTKAAGKPVVVSMADYAASGGYLISANADWIYAEPGTLTGSIGVFAGKFDLSGTYEKMGVSTHSFERGDMADLLSFSEGFDDAERAVFKGYIEDFYEQFLTIVSEGRGMERDAVDAVAQGRVWTGSQALERGLVDELGSLDDAIAKAAELAEVEDPGVVRFPQRRTFFEVMMEEFDSSSTGPTLEVSVDLPLPGDLDATVREHLSVMEAIERAGGVAVWLPGNVTVR